MFKSTGVTRINLVGKDGGSRCEAEGVYKKKMVSEKKRKKKEKDQKIENEQKEH